MEGCIKVDCLIYQPLELCKFQSAFWHLKNSTVLLLFFIHYEEIEKQRSFSKEGDRSKCIANV